MATPEEIAQQQKLLATFRSNLSLYLEQQALLGTTNTPPHIHHGILDSRRNIQRIKDVLQGWGITVEDHPDDIGYNTSSYTKHFFLEDNKNEVIDGSNSIESAIINRMETSFGYINLADFDEFKVIAEPYLYFGIKKVLGLSLLTTAIILTKEPIEVLNAALEFASSLDYLSKNRDVLPLNWTNISWWANLVMVFDVDVAPYPQVKEMQGLLDRAEFASFDNMFLWPISGIRSYLRYDVPTSWGFQLYDLKRERRYIERRWKHMKPAAFLKYLPR